ncbi:voltage-dependent calcium channel subunit alpha-2/delta-1 isoform X2 [Callorhinchus milii]|uniref:voltage-dependent calcium channel subunit alpha-2/delta-1 isoform X2 n=1 Tax=Callorhinchus milii TaxID=7868 RepID=UPI000457319B|nr:voltage-dependent calcium channel subunit alpha-2/delta-1 isoform X2 [Callorhinchus milii]|eukprot:gi/632947596/ref/XP_007889125.1/ PREDICTED: voltage-dependent calcium channel subunit alpha-2/delta-1 isoform X2 [Callorhinchus milii]
MAAPGSSAWKCLLAVVQLCLMISYTSQEGFPPVSDIRSWADKMKEELVTLIHSASGMDDLKSIYAANRQYYTIEMNNARHLVESAAREIEKLLSNKVKALKRLASAAEEFQQAHAWKEEFGDNDVIYYNAKDEYMNTERNESRPRIKPDFQPNRAFRRLVDFNHTAVHIPTDIYEGSTIVLNELNWTAALDNVFKKNKEEDPTLLWQVFGSATGLARYYPASPWVDLTKTSNRIDLYDVRRRPWYIQGAASPKDMLILVDVSGSVSGLTLKLIRTSVSEMLETLSDDDYVNVVSFSDQVKSVSCFKDLVQANVRNKKVLKDAVNRIQAKGITDYKKGFEFAFEQLKNLSESRANCNKIIMLFTDGGEERAQEIFAKDNKDKKIRVFTFSVGQHNYDKGPIQWMACANKGYYFEIPSIGAIRINTQEYLDVLGRPMVLAGVKAKQVQWTNVYLDALELGLVITGTLPVFNLTKDASGNQNQLILGVMGIDVSLEDVKRLTPRYTLGPNGYYFAIDPNGYVLLHPNLQPKSIGVGIPKVYLRERHPNAQNPKSQEPVTLDFLDAELENEIKVEIRHSMIEGENGEKTVHTLIKSYDERYIDKGIRTYTWTPVNGTDYSLASVLPPSSTYYIKAKLEEAITQAKHLESIMPDNFDTSGYVYVAPREYCNGLTPSNNNTAFLESFIHLIDRQTPNSPNCKTDLINNLLLDAGFTSELVTKYWSKQKPDGVLARFVATDGGITRIYPKRAGEEWTANPETYEASYYKRSLNNNFYIFTAPYINKTWDGIQSSAESGIMASRAVEIKVDRKTLMPAVLGVKIDVNAWMENFTRIASNSKCFAEICDCTKNSKHLDCVILDDGGFLLISNQDEYIGKIGKFFGEIDPSLMRRLLNASLYSFSKSYDYQSVCDPESETKAGAGLRSVYVPSIADILNIGWWASTAAWALVQQAFISLTLPQILDAADTDSDDFSEPFAKSSCITEQTQYYFYNDTDSFSGLVDCGNCSRLFHAQKLSDTNLVFILVESKPTCQSCDSKSLLQAEQKSDGPDPCILAQQPRYRKGPEVCFDSDENEDDSECGGSSGLSSSLWSMIGIQLVLLWLFSSTRSYPS